MSKLSVQAVLCGLVLSATLDCASVASHSDAEYVGGTVKAIPSNTPGTLDLSDPTDVVFRYGRNFYRLPFEKIKSYEIERSRPAVRAFGRVTVPGVPWKQEQILNLSFRGSNNEVGVVSFKIKGKDAGRTEWALKARVDSSQDASSAAGDGARPKLPEAWWGDRWWRTNRNAALWPSTAADPAGTK